MTKRDKVFSIPASGIYEVLDALFMPAPDELDGWVYMTANEAGRVCIGALFPRAYIAWRDAAEGAPRDWRSFSFHVPNTVEATEHTLPLEITGGADLHDATSEALAYLLAYGVSRQGGRSGFRGGDGTTNILKPRSADN